MDILFLAASYCSDGLCSRRVSLYVSITTAAGSHSVNDDADLRFRPSQALVERLQESPEPGSALSLSLGWYPEHRAQLAAFCGQPAVLHVLVDAFDRVSETNESNNLASVTVNMVNCPGTCQLSPAGRFQSR